MRQNKHKHDDDINQPCTFYLKPCISARTGERGNIFLIILMGVILFAALSFSISRGLRSDNTSNLSNQEVALAAADILAYAQKLERAVNRMRRKGISENDISFDQNFTAGYNHTPAQDDTHKIFHISGGSVSWKSPPKDVNDGSDWLFSGATCIAGIGTGTSGCDSDTDTSNEELITTLANMNTAVCTEINDRLNISGIPADTGGGASTVKYQGSFADGTEIILPGGPFSAACFSRAGNNHFYFVLIER